MPFILFTFPTLNRRAQGQGTVDRSFWSTSARNVQPLQRRPAKPSPAISLTQLARSFSRSWELRDNRDGRSQRCRWWSVPEQQKHAKTIFGSHFHHVFTDSEAWECSSCCQKPRSKIADQSKVVALYDFEPSKIDWPFNRQKPLALSTGQVSQ